MVELLLYRRAVGKASWRGQWVKLYGFAEGVLWEYAMSIQLTPEQEHRIRNVVNAGAYRSAEEALDAAVAAVEMAAAPDFDGTQEELEELLLDGLHSGTAVEADEKFWDKLRAATDSMAVEHQSRKHIREN